MGRFGVFGSACDPITIGHLVTMDMVIERELKFDIDWSRNISINCEVLLTPNRPF